MYVCAQFMWSVHGLQKRELSPLELELDTVASSPVDPEIQIWSHGGAASTLNCWANSQALTGNFYLRILFFLIHYRDKALEVPKNLIVTDGKNKTITVKYVGDTLSNSYGWMALLLDQETYSLQFQNNDWMERSLQVILSSGVSSFHTKVFLSAPLWRNRLEILSGAHEGSCSSSIFPVGLLVSF